MLRLKEVGVLGATAVLAGGVAYLIWNYTSSCRERNPESLPEEGEGNGEEKKKEQVVPVAAAPVAAAAAPNAESRPVNSVGTQVLVLGLDGAGKTSLLHYWATGSLMEDVHPTQGFNAVSINREDLHIEFLEIGGKEELRPYWQRYVSKALMLVFVVDASYSQRFPVAKRHLHELLASDPHLPLMVLANKQDLPGACSITDLHDALSLSQVGNRRLFLISAHAKKGQSELSSGARDARDLIVQLVCDSR